MELSSPKKGENVSQNEQTITIEEYKKLVEDEISQYRAKLDATEEEYKSLMNETATSIKFTESQQNFLDNCPDYAEYLRTIRKFHDIIALRQMKENQDMKAVLRDGDNFIRSSLRQLLSTLTDEKTLYDVRDS